MELEAAVFSKLSKREKEVVNLIVGGLTNKEIAICLTVTEGTVKNYIHSILLKLDLKSRCEIIILGLQRR